MTQYEKLRNNIVSLIKDAYLQGYDDGKCNSPSFEDGFVADCRMEIDGALSRCGINEDYWQSMP